MRNDHDVFPGVDEFRDDRSYMSDVVLHGRIAGGCGPRAEEFGGLRGEASGSEKGGNFVEGGGTDPEAGDEEDCGGHSCEPGKRGVVGLAGFSGGV